MKALLTSINPIKLAATRRVLEKRHKDIIVEGINVKCNNPEQPVNNGYLCALNRLLQVSDRPDFLVSIENSLVSEGDSVYDVCYVIIQGSKGSFSGQSKGILVANEFYNEASQHPVKGEAPGFGVLEGFSVTVGECINKKYPDIPKGNWMKDPRFGGIDREDQIIEALENALRM